MDAVGLGVIWIALTIYWANQQQSKGNTNSVAISISLYILASIGMLMGVYVLVLALFGETFLDASSQPLESVSLVDALWVFGFAVVSGGFSLVIIFSQTIREWLATTIFRTDHQLRFYDPNNIVHTTALVLAIFQLTNSFATLVLLGGIEGLAENVTSVDLTALLMNFLIYVLVSLLGVGLFIRRTERDVLKRLGLTNITMKHLGIGAVVGFILFWGQVLAIMVWQFLVSPELFSSQTAAASQIFDSFSGSLLLGIVMAILTGVGEELLFRGALQPIFGNLAVSIFFTLLHTQYGFTPATLVILGVSLSFGWLRDRHSIGASMMAHAIYNAIPFLLVSLFNSVSPTI